MEYDKTLYNSLEAVAKQYLSLEKKLEESTLPVSELKEVNRAIKRTRPVYEKFNQYKALI